MYKRVSKYTNFEGEVIGAFRKKLFLERKLQNFDISIRKQKRIT